MPIGKNALKRVENNGYSNVETSAPDMEHSVIANLDPQVAEKLIAPVEEKTNATVAPVKPKRKYTRKAKAPAPVEEKVEAPAKPKRKYTKKAKAPEKNGFERVEVGAQMPYYLL